jgi:aminopeptidase N
VGGRSPHPPKAAAGTSLRPPMLSRSLVGRRLHRPQRVSGKTTWVWRESDPMAPYLATTTLGRFDLTISKTSAGIPSYVAVDPQLAKGQVLSKLPEAVDFYTSIYGSTRSTP